MSCAASPELTLLNVVIVLLPGVNAGCRLRGTLRYSTVDSSAAGARVVHDQVGDQLETDFSDGGIGTNGTSENPIGREGFQPLVDQLGDKRIVGRAGVAGGKPVGADPVWMQDHHDRRLGDIGVSADVVAKAG